MRLIPQELTLRWCYEFSTGSLGEPWTRARFFTLLETCDCERIVGLVCADLDRPATGELRALERLRKYTRADRPSLESLRREPRPNEQTLQWMFLERAHLQVERARIIARELPVSSASEWRSGAVDLLVVDRETGEPTLVELKHAKANDSLSGVLFEVLSHWAFFTRHCREFATQLAHEGLVVPTSMPTIQVAIAAPETYFAEAVRRSCGRRRHNEVRAAARIIDCLRDRFGVNVRLLAVDNDWQRRGPGFRITDWTIPGA